MGVAQGAVEESGRPLSDVMFCVLDLETTGGSPTGCSITEIGALKVRLGERQGSFHTLVRPPQLVPAFVRLLTGITDEMLVEPPPVEAVLPSLLEFLRDSVLVAHNARFDVGFLNAALDRSGYPRLSNEVVDTRALARKMLAGEVPNNRLETLARYLRCAHRPCHRAFADVLATCDVLHHLIERASGYGVTTLDDLLSLTATRVDGTFEKIRLTDALPRGPGIYRFVGAAGQTLYVGKATDLRSRVRSYFYGDPRRRIRDLLRETQSITYESHGSTLEAEVAEVRAIAAEMPPYNRAGKKAATWYMKVSVGRPKISATRKPKEDGSAYLGPFTSLKQVRALIDTVRDATRVHRCSEPARCRGCAFSEMNACVGESRSLHMAEARLVVEGLTREPDLLLKPLEEKVLRLASQERFEEAADLRARAEMLGRQIRRSIEIRRLIEAGDISLSVEDRSILVTGGRVAGVRDAAEAGHGRAWLSAEAVREGQAILSWLAREDRQATA
ncbi:MAG: exonuclease domain-containing protein [Actinomycetota bacterium]|nr:exonuclease domain-containing protein [Actinomycetota bacterium]